MRIRITVPDEHVTPDVVDPVLEAVTRLDEHMVRSGQSPTSSALIAKGAVWRPEPPGDEHFDHGATIEARGWGDCDDWAPLHAASLRASGEDPGARARVVPSGPNTFHAIVERSTGEIEDPSERAGMKSKKVVGDAGDMMVYACDPHDGRIYQGALAPTVGPLSIHCGPQMSVRGAYVVGGGHLFEGRVDLPIVGSRLVRCRPRRRKVVHVRSYNRHMPARVSCGALPYAISVTHMAGSPDEALHGALVGAIMCGDASEMTTSADRYKLLAIQSAMAGSSPGEVREQLLNQILADVHAAGEATGTDPREHAGALLAELASQGHIDGRMFLIGNVRVGDIFSDVSHAASGIVNAVKNVVSKTGPWAGDILHGLEAITSVVPGLGTAVSDVFASAESAYDTLSALLSGNPLEGAIKAAYDFAMASIPGAAALRFVLDPAVGMLLALVVRKEPVESAVLNSILASVPAGPARDVVASLARMIVSHLGVKKTTSGAKPAPVNPSAVSVDPRALAAAHATGSATPRMRPPPGRPSVRRAIVLHAPKAGTLIKPPGVAHAATPASPAVPPHPTAHPAPGLAAPRTPGAPPGASQWHCAPLPGGHWACSWV